MSKSTYPLKMPSSVKPIFDSCPPDYRQFSDVSH
jgi:hypothetical protein